MGDPSLTDVDEDASPISSRPPVVGHISAAGNFEEFLPAGGVGTSHHDDEDALGGDEADRGRVGIAGGNRWPREETLALLKIRSEMDSVFRDATLKTPLWEDISRKLTELGYKRSAKKCKEKFENLHKYYKRTKEGRAARQDGKSYRFFSQLEALHSTGTGGGSVVTKTSPSMLNPPPSVAATSATNFPVIAPPTPVSSGIGVVNPMPLSSVRMPPPHTKPLSYAQVQVQGPLPPSVGTLFPDLCGSGTTAAPGGLFSGSAVPIGGIGFSSDSSSTYSGSDEFDEDEDGEMEIEGNLKGGEEVNTTRDRKRKSVSSSGNGSGGGSSSQKRMMEFFEGLMKQVVRKQEEMQQRFLEALEKREQDMMIREEAWKRQEMARLAREHELIAQERSVSAARDAAIIAFIQKFTGQTIQLLSAAATVPSAPPPPPPPQPPPQTAPQPPVQSSSSQRHYQKPQEVHQPQQQHKQRQQQMEEKHNANPLKGSEIVMAVPEQQILVTGSVNLERSSSRWPKAEVHALINLRSGLEARYQEAGPKGPLWEAISAGMLGLGYKRNAKRCKEKWENINKYFKKVKESSKKRPEDAKTCPYFYQLDELYRRKIIGGNDAGASTSGVGSINQSELQQQHQQQPPQQQQSVTVLEYPETSNGKRNDTGEQETPEDIMKEQHHQDPQQNLLNYDKIQAPANDNLEQADDEEDYEDDLDNNNDDDDSEATEEAMKMAYKIQFQRQNTGSSNGGRNGASSFLAMVQ